MTDRSSEPQRNTQEQQQQQEEEEDQGSEIQLAIYNFEKRLNIFHVGIFAHGKEFHYGVKQGVSVCSPRNNGKLFRVIVYNVLPRKMGFLLHLPILMDDGAPLRTNLSLAQLMRVKDSMEIWRFGPDTYRLFRNNCLDFAWAFLRNIATADGPRPISKRALPKEVRQPWCTQPVRALDRRVHGKSKRKMHILQLPIH